jgi:DNA-binding HxlR family transcriptional regulator
MKLQKITKNDEGGGAGRRRRYDDACGAAHAMDLLGERWALFVVRELMTGPKRFGDLRRDLPGISANILTQRLEGLEAVGILARRRLPPPADVPVYELTPWGYEAEPIFQALGRWAARSPAHDPTLHFSTASLILSMRTMLDARRAEGLDVRIGFNLGRESFRSHLSNGRIELSAGPAKGADLVLSGAPPVIAAALYGGRSLAALEAAGVLSLEGDRALAERFVTLFPMPEKVELPRS